MVQVANAATKHRVAPVDDCRVAAQAESVVSARSSSLDASPIGASPGKPYLRCVFQADHACEAIMPVGSCPIMLDKGQSPTRQCGQCRPTR